MLLTLAPPAIVLGASLAARRLVWPWAMVALGGGFIIGTLATSAIAEAWTRSAERVEEAAAALEERRPPAHLHHEGADAMGLAEHRLLEVADAVARELEVLAEQRDEFEAILRSMTEAVVVTGTARRRRAGQRRGAAACSRSTPTPTIAAARSSSSAATRACRNSSRAR